MITAVAHFAHMGGLRRAQPIGHHNRIAGAGMRRRSCIMMRRGGVPATFFPRDHLMI